MSEVEKKVEKAAPSAEKARRQAIVDAYKISNPVKFALKEARLKEWIANA